MQFLPLLGAHLKSQALIERFEAWDLDVIYSYDRLSENEPDRYEACWSQGGASFVFDENQRLSTIFLFPRGDESHFPCDLDASDVARLDSADAVKNYARASDLRIAEGQANSFGKHRDWVRLDRPGHCIHYEFQNGELVLVTLSFSNPQD